MIKRLNSMNPLRAVDKRFGLAFGRICAALLAFITAFSLLGLFLPELKPFAVYAVTMPIYGFLLLVCIYTLVPRLRRPVEAVKRYIGYRELGRLLEGEHFTEEAEKTLYASQNFILMNDVFVPRSLIYNVTCRQSGTSYNASIMLSTGQLVSLRFAEEHGVTWEFIENRIFALSKHPEVTRGNDLDMGRFECRQLREETDRYLASGKSFASLIGVEQ